MGRMMVESHESHASHHSQPGSLGNGNLREVSASLRNGNLRNHRSFFNNNAMRTILLKLIAWALTLLVRWGRSKIESVLERAPERASSDELQELAYEPLAERLIAMDKAGDFARVDAALRKLRERALGSAVGDGGGE
jgi:hypothetical protein